MIKMKRVIVLLQFVFLVCSVSAGPIHNAAKNGDLEGVKAELDKGVDVNSETTQHWTLDRGAGATAHFTSQHWTPLHLAIKYNHLNMVDLLIKKGADLNSRVDSLVWINSDRWGPNEKWYKDLTALDHASILRIDLWASDVGSKKQRKINSEIINILKENGGVWEEIQPAVAGGGLAFVNQFLDEGGWVDTVDISDSTLLWYAARAGQYELVNLLLAKGANINAKNIYEDTPLDGAKAKNCSLVYSYLRQNGGKFKGEIIPVDPEKIPLQDAAKRLDLVERTLKGIQNLILDGPSGDLSIKKLQGLFVISGQAGNRVEVQYHTGDNNWQKREIVTLQSNRQLYIDSSSFDEKRFYRIKKID
jgi:ankyrin repeat protein